MSKHGHPAVPKNSAAKPVAPSSRRRSLLAVGLVCVACLSAALGVRLWWGSASATAQAPVAPAAAAPRAAAQIPQSAPNARRPDAAAKVVAVVNGQPISREQLGQETLRRYGKDVVENLVNKHLILQACQQQGLQVTAQEIELEVS
ncbi:MAG: hypothetical protein KDA41_04850, partial [Planctomycetales bacterium]|nr:hypothetical protein [Planctomycetales bacterium]